MFKIHSINGGEDEHKRYKLAIEDLKYSKNDNLPYGSFTLSIRDAKDSDNSKTYVERYTNNENAPNITFENFVLLHNPSLDFRHELTDWSNKETGTPATDWEQIYNSDLELHKKSAIAGYKNALLAMGDAPANTKVG